jgi:hypothetical protein
MKCDINRQATCTQFTRPLLDSYTNRAKNRLQDGEMIYLTDEETYLVWMNKEWISLPKKVEGQNQGFSMTAYDLNKSLIAQMPVLEDWTEACAVIDRYADDNENFFYCEVCGRREHVDNGHWLNDDMLVCEECFNETRQCAHCGDHFFDDDIFYDREHECYICRYCKTEMEEY